MMPAPIEHWHQFVQSRELDSLKRLLADDVVFESPVVHTPQVGKAKRCSDRRVQEGRGA